MERHAIRGLRRTRYVVALSLLIALAALALHAERYAGFLSDDALISLRYSERLIEGRGLSWNDGERVEGYSNLLWVLACALLGGLGLDLIVASRILGYAGFASAIAALIWLHGSARGGGLLPPIVGGLAMALSGCFAVWAVGGLEQPLLAGLLAWALVLLAARTPQQGTLAPLPASGLLAPGLLLALVCLTRPDGPLFVACACLALLLADRFRRPAWRASLWLALLPALFVLLQLGFRFVYYGDLVPNTARSKLAFTSQRISSGFDHWWQGMRALLPLALAAGAQLVLGLRQPALRARTLLFALPLGVWSAWLIVIGGDIFPGRRHHVVLVLLMALLAADLAAAATLHVRRAELSKPGGRAALATTWVVAGAGLAALFALQWSFDPGHLRALREVVWARQGEALGRLLGAGFAQEQPLLAVTAAGALPYFSKLPALDMLGLNDRYLALHPPVDLGRGRIAHELGDGAYFLRRAPDLVVFCGTAGSARACSRGGIEMQSDERFTREYQLVSFRAVHPLRMRGQVFVRTQSPRIGIRSDETGERIVIPGLLLAAEPGGEVVLDATGRFTSLLGPERIAKLTGLRLAPGHWRATVEGSSVAAVSLTASGDASPRADGSEIVIAGPGPGSVELAVVAGKAGARILRVLLSRSDGGGDAAGTTGAPGQRGIGRTQPQPTGSRPSGVLSASLQAHDALDAADAARLSRARRK